MSAPNEKKMVTDVFVEGARRGWNIAIGSMLPNVLMVFVLIYVLKLTGILDLFFSLLPFTTASLNFHSFS